MIITKKITLVIFLFLSFNVCSQKNDYLRLLIYPKLNIDTIYIRDSLVFFQQNYCVQIEIDTINIKNIKKYKYGGYILKRCRTKFKKEQLFNLNELKSINEIEILSIEISTSLIFELEKSYIKNKGSCISEEQKKFIYNVYQKNMKKIEKDKKSHIYIGAEIKGINSESFYITFTYPMLNIK